MQRPAPRSIVATLAITLALSAAGCAASGEAQGPSKSTSDSTKTDPTAILKYGAPFVFDSLDPILAKTQGTIGVTFLMYDRLTQVDAQDRIQPMLAESWQFEDAGQTMILKLRDDVTFPDGTPFDASVVKKNLERTKTLTGSMQAGVLSAIAGVEAVDDFTVKITLDGDKGANLPAIFAAEAGMMVNPAALTADGNLDASKAGIAGTGPYQVTAWTPNEKVSYRAIEDYWDGEDSGRLGGIELTQVLDATARMNGVLNGQLDFAFLSAPTDITQGSAYGEQGRLKTGEIVPFRNVLGVWLNADHESFRDLEARQAVARSIDRDAVASVFDGTCTVRDQLYPESSPWAIPDYEYPLAADEDEAKRLIDEAGGVAFPLSYTAKSNVELPAQIVADQLTKAGIDVALNPQPNTTINADWQEGKSPALIINTLDPGVDPGLGVAKYLLGPYHVAAGPEREQVEKLAAEALSAQLSEDDRAALYGHIWEIALEQAWFIPICSLSELPISTSKVEGIDNVPWLNTGIGDLRHLAKTE